MKRASVSANYLSSHSNKVFGHTLLLLFIFIFCIRETIELTSKSNSNEDHNSYVSGNGGVNLKKIQQLLDLTSDDVDSLNLESVFQDEIKIKLKSKDKIQDGEGIIQEQQQIPIKSDPHRLHGVTTKHSNHDGHNGHRIKGDQVSDTADSDLREKNKIYLNYQQQQEDSKDSIEKETRFRKKLKVPEGSSLSLAVQVSRPNILPGLFFQHEGIILDAVVEVPMWFDLDVFAKAVYDSHHPKPSSKPPPTDKPLIPVPTLSPLLPPLPSIGLPGMPPLIGPPPTKNLPPATGEGRLIGYERCFLYTQLARIMEVSQSVSHACLLRTICEIHSVLGFRPHYQNSSIIFELIRLLLTPSLGAEDNCYKPYAEAERTGRKKNLCYSYITQCPISFASIITSNFVAHFPN